MEYVCPICNGMATYLLRCPHCGKQMENRGTVVEFLDDYSPYLAMDITQLVDGAAHDQCVHLFYCEECKYDKRVSIQRIKM
ncbi:hypothetical protein [Crassaminicella profunda]|uniref:hypothetical protein n=1 Tax=Crassaminicella profunda TaxID=1286698 RepID=UPI001CA6B79B|nr:hypothetical protein [Crassaminicella profunda]QZY57242.1 hypothetical protein K7H06_10115 [Crassaminicella profunda]